MPSPNQTFNSRSNSELFMQFQADLPRTHLQSAIDFHKQKARSAFVDPRKGPNDKRFDNFNRTPAVCGRFKEHPPPRFEKCLPRDNLLFKQRELFLNDYDPNSEFVKSRLALGGIALHVYYSVIVPDFKKTTDRPPSHLLRDVPQDYASHKVENSRTKQGHYNE